MGNGSGMRTWRTKAISVVILSFFVFQLGRVYLIPTIQAFYICPYTQVWASQAPSHNGPAEISGTEGVTETSVEAALPPSQEDPTSIRGCKDAFDGMGLTPAQPFGTPAEVAVVAPEVSGFVVPGGAASAPEIFLPSLFQPPRA